MLVLVFVVVWMIVWLILWCLYMVYVNDMFVLCFVWLSLEWVMFLLIGWLLVFGVCYVLIGIMLISVFCLVVVLLFGLVIFYFGFYVLCCVLLVNGELYGMFVVVECVLIMLMWIGMVFYVLGVLGDVVDYFDGICFVFGGK